jgi:hypothetical protein
LKPLLNTRPPSTFTALSTTWILGLEFSNTQSLQCFQISHATKIIKRSWGPHVLLFVQLWKLFSTNQRNDPLKDQVLIVLCPRAKKLKPKLGEQTQHQPKGDWHKGWVRQTPFCQAVGRLTRLKHRDMLSPRVRGSPLKGPPRPIPLGSLGGYTRQVHSHAPSS